MRRLQAALRLPPAFCRLLAARGLRSPDDAKCFLRPQVSHLLEPADLHGAPEAARRLAQAVERGETVLVHGDYDVDGIAGTALVVHWLRGLGGKAEGFVPTRRDGYDLSRPGLERAEAVGARVLMTVDCGIRAHDWVRRAAEQGVDVLVTDHHRPGRSPPAEALAVVDPNQRDCTYANKGLCGAGVAFKVVQLAARMLGRPAAEAWRRLDLVGLATLADQVSLVGENRVLARLGLQAVGATARPGLLQLVRNACGDPGAGRPDWEDAVFRIAPRLNAAGRVGDPATALALLLADGPARARSLAETLERDNATRKALQKRTLNEALAELRGRDLERDRAVVLARTGWPAGVIGIVASQLVERVCRPVLLFALDGDSGRGSARSVPCFDVHEALEACAEHLGRFGGHPMAAGMDIRADRVAAFSEAFHAHARARLAAADLRPSIDVDLEVAVEDLRGRFAHWCSYLAPFGRGNPEPVFAVRNVRARQPRRLGDGAHVRFRIAEDRFGLPAVGFGLGERFSPEDLASSSLDVAFTLAQDRRGPYPTMEARAVGVRRARRRDAAAR